MDSDPSETSPAWDKPRVRCTETVGETVCSGATGGLITTGGGFSAVHEREKVATWQARVVSAYLAQQNLSGDVRPAHRRAASSPIPPSGYFNPLGRGYPDISVLGSLYFVYINGQVMREAGTSASTPTVAAMVTLWNDLRLSLGLPPMGKNLYE